MQNTESTSAPLDSCGDTTNHPPYDQKHLFMSWIASSEGGKRSQLNSSQQTKEAELKLGLQEPRHKEAKEKAQTNEPNKPNASQRKNNTEQKDNITEKREKNTEQKENNTGEGKERKQHKT